MGDLTFHAVEIGLADARREAEDGGLKDAAHTVALAARRADGVLHGLLGVRIQQREAAALIQQGLSLCSQRRRVVQGEGGVGHPGAPADVGHDLDARSFQRPQHDAAARHEGRRDPAGKVPAAPRVLKAVVFGIGRIIRVAGAEQVGGLGVIAAAGVLVFDHQGDGGAGGPAVQHAGKELDLIRFHAGGGKPVAPRPALVHAEGEEFLVHRHARRHSIQHGPDGAAMALAEDGQGEVGAKRVLHGHSSMPSRGRSPSTGMVSARQQPRPGTLMMVIWPPCAFLSWSISASTFSLL